jgi:hypothetical protein
MQFYKSIGMAHEKYLKAMKLKHEDIAQLSFHIKDYQLLLDVDNISYVVKHPTDGGIESRIQKNIKYD